MPDLTPLAKELKEEFDDGLYDGKAVAYWNGIAKYVQKKILEARIDGINSVPYLTDSYVFEKNKLGLISLLTQQKKEQERTDGNK